MLTPAERDAWEVVFGKSGVVSRAVQRERRFPGLVDHIDDGQRTVRRLSRICIHENQFTELFKHLSAT